MSQIRCKINTSPPKSLSHLFFSKTQITQGDIREAIKHKTDYCFTHFIP